MKLGVIVIFFLIVAPSRANAQSFNLKQSIAFAMDHSPTLNSSQRSLHITDLEKRNAIAKFLPSLDFTSTHGYEDMRPTPMTPPRVTEFNFALTETLYDNGVSLSQYREAKYKQEQSEILFERDRNKLCRDVAAQYFKYSMAARNLEIQESQHTLIEKQYRLVSEDYHNGQKTRKDFLRFKTQLSRSAIELVRAKNEVGKARQELLRFLAATPEEAVSISFTPDDQKIEMSEVPASPLPFESHYEFKNAEIQRKINDEELALVKRTTWPELSLTTGANAGSANYMDTGSTIHDNRSISWNALIGLKYNIFDWGIRSRNAAIAVEKKEQENNTLSTDLNSLRSEINRLLLDLGQLKQNYTLSEELLKLEEANLKLLEDDYRAGRVPYIDLITGLNDLADAKLKFYNAFYDLKNSIYAYRYHEGTLYDWLQK